MAEPDRREERTPRVRALVVDDDPGIARIVTLTLEQAGCATRSFTDGAEALRSLRETPADIVVTDLRMPGMDGMELLRSVKSDLPETDVIVITGCADKDDAIAALRLGAFDFLEKPFDGVALTNAVRRTVSYREAVRDRDRFADELSTLTAQQAEQWGIGSFVGKSGAVREVLRRVRLLQQSAGTPALILGESGTGKELIARAIHYGSNRSRRPFIPVNCAAVPAELAESMLFGHSRGAFTGAVADKKGCFELAHGGTIFLDEIGDMPLEVQAKLLRVLEDGVVVPVGRAEGRQVDARVVAATNADLNERLEAGRFRTDLFYRLAGFTLEIAPLRRRPEDIPLLARHFVHLLSSEMGIGAPAILPKAMDALCAHPFPGNVRELKNTMERALLESGGATIGPGHICFIRLGAPPAQPAGADPAAPSPAPPADELPLELAAAEKAVIERAIRTAAGNMAAASRLLGINRTRLYRKAAAHGIRPGPPPGD